MVSVLHRGEAIGKQALLRHPQGVFLRLRPSGQRRQIQLQQQIAHFLGHHAHQLLLLQKGEHEREAAHRRVVQRGGGDRAHQRPFGGLLLQLLQHYGGEGRGGAQQRIEGLGHRGQGDVHQPLGCLPFVQAGKPSYAQVLAKLLQCCLGAVGQAHVQLRGGGGLLDQAPLQHGQKLVQQHRARFLVGQPVALLAGKPGEAAPMESFRRNVLAGVQPRFPVEVVHQAVHLRLVAAAVYLAGKRHELLRRFQNAQAPRRATSRCNGKAA